MQFQTALILPLLTRSAIHPLAVVPVLIGPVMLLWTMLPAILLGIGGLLLSLFKPSTAKKLVVFLWQQKLFSAVLIAAVWFFFWGPEVHLWGSHAAQGLGSGGDWPAFRGGPTRTGAAGGASDPTVGKVVWSYNKYPMVYSTPTVCGDRIYLSTMDIGVFGDKGAIACLDAKTGAELWRYAPAGFRATFSSPSVLGDYLVCGEGLHWYQRARITCLDIKKGGQKLWEFRTSYHVETSPCLYNGKCYVGAGHDGYYCLDLRGDGKGGPRVIWHLIGAQYRGCESCPIVSDGVLYVGLGNEGQAILAIDPETGKELWRIPTHYPVFAPPTVADGKLYIAMGNGDFVNDAEAVRPVKLEKMRKAGKSEAEIAEADKWLGPVGEVWCVDLKTRQADWKYSCGRTILGCLALQNGKLYFGSRDGTFYCLSTEGKLVAKFNAHEPILASPALGTDHVYFVTKGGRLYCRTADKLDAVWDLSLGSGDMFASSPTLGLDHVYIGTMNDGLRCVGQRVKPQPLWRDGERGGYADRGAWPAKGDLDWRYPSDDSASFKVTAPLMAMEGFGYVPAEDNTQPALLKIKLDRKLDDKARVEWRVPFSHAITVPPAGSRQQVFVVDGNKSDSGRALHALDTALGKEAWHYDLEDGASGAFTLDGTRLGLWSGAQKLTCLELASGKSLWSTQIGNGVGTPAICDGLMVAATSTELVTMDAQCGVVLWRVPLNGATCGPVCAANNVAIATSSGIEVRSLQNGAVVWNQAIGPCTVPPVADAERVAVVTAAGEMWEYRTSDGVVLAHRSGADPTTPPLLATPQLTLVHTPKDFLALEVDAANPSTQPLNPPRWMGSIDWLGQMGTPIVVSDQHVLFATASKGVVCLRPRKQ